MILLIKIYIAGGLWTIPQVQTHQEYYLSAWGCREAQKQIVFKFNDNRLSGTAECLPWVDVRG